MFVVLRENTVEGGFFKKRRRRKSLVSSIPQAVPTRNGLPFFVLDVPDNMSENEWRKTALKCGKYASKIVAPRQLFIPDSGDIKRYLPSVIPSSAVFNTAVGIISGAGLNPHKITVTLTDRNALRASQLTCLLPFASTVRIITSHCEKYETVCREVFAKYGASPVIRHSYEPCEGKEIVICTDSSASREMKNAAVFGCKKLNTDGLSFCGSGIELSQPHQSVIPPEIDTLDFADAVTKLCISSEYKKSVFRNICCSRSCCEAPSPVKCLQCYAADSVTKL